MGRRKKEETERLGKNESLRKDGSYMYRVQRNHKTYCIYAKTIKELHEKRRALEADINDNIRPLDKTTLDQMFDRDMELKTLKENTRSNYIYMYDLFVRGSWLGKTKVKDICFSDIEQFYKELKKGTRTHKDGLSRSSIKLIHSLLSSAMKRAVRDRIIRNNPCEGALDVLEKETNKKFALKQWQCDALLDFCSNHPEYYKHVPYIIFCKETGLRHGEAAGLQWSDIYRKENRICVERQLLYKKYNNTDGWEFHIETPKTEAGKREVALSDEAKKALSQLREHYLQKGIRSQEVCGLADYIFVKSNGQPYASNATNCFLNNIVKAYNRAEEMNAKKENRKPELMPHISAHILRHTAVSIWREKKMSKEAVASMAGHSIGGGVTEKVYNHYSYSFDNQIKEMKKIGAIG